MKTRVTELFGIQYPILCGGMLWATDARLCAAISEAGGLGCITADQYTSGAELQEAIREVKSLTGKPFGVNITLMKSFRITAETFMEFFRVCAEEKVANIEVSGLFATDFIPMLHEAGVHITHKVGAVRHAMKIEHLGYDAVIVAGVEEGGHPLSDNVATTVLLPKVAENVKIPVIATGGMVDGKSMAAALCLGADGIMMATRFIASDECWVHDNIKNWIVGLKETDTELFCKTTLQARGVKNSVFAKVSELESNGADQSEIVRAVSGKKLRQALAEGDTEGAAFLFGQSIGRINEVKPCKAIIDGIIAEAEATLHAKAALMG
ncbi:MAG: nitronate monooxygenase [Oscillospiraceae bacterium]|nr:nitronate monooxygenase [Oscillospiraceae bacterium]